MSWVVRVNFPAPCTLKDKLLFALIRIISLNQMKIEYVHEPDMKDIEIFLND